MHDSSGWPGRLPNSPLSMPTPRIFALCGSAASSTAMASSAERSRRKHMIKWPSTGGFSFDRPSSRARWRPLITTAMSLVLSPTP